MHADLSHPSARRHPFLRALGLASLAIAGLILPFVWDVLSLVNEMPKMDWLQQALAQVTGTDSGDRKHPGRYDH